MDRLNEFYIHAAKNVSGIVLYQGGKATYEELFVEDNSYYIKWQLGMAAKAVEFAWESNLEHTIIYSKQEYIAKGFHHWLAKWKSKDFEEVKNGDVWRIISEYKDQIEEMGFTINVKKSDKGSDRMKELERQIWLELGAIKEEGYVRIKNNIARRNDPTPLAEGSIMPSGKYRGHIMKVIPAEYYIYCWQNDMMNDKVRAYVESHFTREELSRRLQ